MFMHENIRKDINVTARESECPWLLRSPQTDSFNLLEVSGDWSIWTGTINTGVTFHSFCNGCDSDADCNYHGVCTERGCDCEEDPVIGVARYTGKRCEHPRPCARILGDGEDFWNIVPMDCTSAWKAYGRGVFTFDEGGNKGFVGPKDELILMYTGSRWFGAVFEDGKDNSREYWNQFAAELHAFWDRIYSKKTHFVSNPTSRSDPIAVDFFEIGRRGEKYGPLGELMPLQTPPGSGYFECALDASELTDFISGLVDMQC